MGVDRYPRGPGRQSALGDCATLYDVKALLRFFLGAALPLVQLAAVLVFTALASIGYSYIVADSYAEGGEPPGHFPLVEKVAGGPPSGYRLVHWAERGAGIAPNPQRSFLLPETEGQFTLDPIGEFVPVVSFEVLEDSGGRQRIAVAWADDDYERHSRYVTDGTQIEPEYFRIWGAGMVFVGILPGILGAWLFGLGVRRARRAWTGW